jgi:hypothetical protein
MNHMALITVMGDLYFLLFKVLWHGNDLDLIGRTSLDDLIMAAKAECFYILTSLHRKFPYNFAILHMVSIGTMAHFTGNVFMDTSLMNRTDRAMTFKAGIIGFIPDSDISLILNITSSVMTILTHCFREKLSPGKYP